MKRDEQSLVPVRHGYPDRAGGTLSRARTIVVNGRDHVIESETVSHAQLVSMAYPGIGTQASRSLTVTYEGGPVVAPQGLLTPHQRVQIVDGEQFIVARTHAS